MAKKAYIGVANFEKRNLPSGYTQVEYIQSSGAVYVDTKFMPNNNTRVVMDASFVSAPTATAALFGSRVSASDRNYALLWTSSGSKFRSDYNKDGSQTWDVVTTTRRVYDKNKETTMIDGVSQSYTNGTFQTIHNLYLFASNMNGAAGQYASISLYACQIYDNSALVRDFVPCINSAGVVGLYDLIGGAFYQGTGTGSLTTGTSTQQSFARKIKKGYVGIDGTARKIKKAYIGIGGGVTYREVEYIQSSGTQYIDTGFTPNQDTRVVCRTLLPLNSKTNWLFGSRYSTDERKYAFAASSANYYSAHYNTVNPRFDKTVAPTGTFTVDFDKQNISIVADGATYTTTSTPTYATFDTPSSMLLFACITGGSVACGSSAIYGCQIYDNGALVRDYVPAINPSGAAGLFDKVTKQFFANAGTGNFTPGTETGVSHISVGVARPCWSGGEATYYGKITALTYARKNLAATSVGDYALFGGGEASTNAQGQTVDVYDKSLTRTKHADGLTQYSFHLAAETNGDYALFAGGTSSSSERYYAYAFDKSLVRTQPSNLRTARSRLAASTTGDYILFAGGQTSSATNYVDAYNRSLSRSNATSLAKSRYSLAGGKVGGRALFAGGTSGSSTSSYQSIVEAYDASLTRSTVSTSLSSARYTLGGASNEKYVIFAGGWSSDSTTDIYDASLTRVNTPAISVGQSYLAGTTLGQYALIGGGYNSAGTVDAFDLSLTRTTPMSGTDLDGNLAAATVGDFALFGGGKNAGQIASVHAITIA